MIKAGGDLQWYNPIRFTTWPRVNNRTHRELLIVDGDCRLHRRRRMGRPLVQEQDEDNAPLARHDGACRRRLRRRPAIGIR